MHLSGSEGSRGILNRVECVCVVWRGVSVLLTGSIPFDSLSIYLPGKDHTTASVCLSGCFSARTNYPMSERAAYV